MGQARSNHAATLLNTGKVLVAGGVGPFCAGCNSGMTAELFDPATGTWSPTGSMSIFRSQHTATLLSNGKVLVAGGNGATAEVYDPATGTFSPSGSMTTTRANHTATLLPDGRVLVSGGQSTSRRSPAPKSSTRP